MHTMTLDYAFRSGAEIWTCPECDRQIILQWEPFKKITLIAGDETRIHTGGKGVFVEPVKAEPLPPVDLDVWGGVFE
jgi:hypothetical protein